MPGDDSAKPNSALVTFGSHPVLTKIRPSVVVCVCCYSNRNDAGFGSKVDYFIQFKDE